MMESSEYVRSHSFVALQLPSEVFQVIQLIPNTTISVGKYGSFQANHVIGRPYHITFEILDDAEKTPQTGLRIVSAAELYANTDPEDDAVIPEVADVRVNDTKDGKEYEVVGENGKVMLRTNRNIMDDSKSQTMTMEEIETLKVVGAGSGKDLIAKILRSHVALDQKTAFALAKYTLRKTRKFLRRFTVLPLDVPLLARYMFVEKEPAKIMELREETLALINSLSNVHYTTSIGAGLNGGSTSGGEGRWLVIDETGGLIVASMAERMGILHRLGSEEQASDGSDQAHAATSRDSVPNGNSNADHSSQPQRSPSTRRSSKLADDNTITVLHANSQPNLALLRFFGFDFGSPSTSHPLYPHLRTMTWLQLIAPEEDLGYTEPETFPDGEILTWKSGRRGNYYRKRSRWERIRTTVDQTRAGGFDGLVIATAMNELPNVLHHAVPLLRGGAPVVIYSPNIESLTELADYYSSGRRSAFITNPPASMPTKDFPVDPTILLATAVQTVRSRPWQVLPGRTHPLMIGRGGSEGYIFSATRVIPAEGKISARGIFKHSKRQKVGDMDSSKQAETREQSFNG